MSAPSSTSPMEEDKEELKPQQEPPGEEDKGKAKVATSLPPSHSASLQQMVHALISEFGVQQATHMLKDQLGILTSSDDEEQKEKSSSDDEEQKEKSSPEEELHRKSSRSVFSLKQRSLQLKDSSSLPLLESGIPLGQPLKTFVDQRKEEIAFLKTSLDHKSRNERHPFYDPFASTDLIKNWPQVNLSVNQLKETKDNLIDKDEERVMKFVQDSGSMESHDQETLELGGKIGVRKDGTEFAHEQKQFNTKEKEGLKGQENDLSMYPFLRESLKFGGNASMLVSCEIIVKEGLSLIGSSKMKELDNKLRELQVQEMEIYLRRVDLILEQTKLLLAAIKSSSSH